MDMCSFDVPDIIFHMLFQLLQANASIVTTQSDKDVVSSLQQDGER